MEFKIIEERELNRLFGKIDSIQSKLEEFSGKAKQPLKDRWLDNQEVMELLKISPRTLQNMRDGKVLPFSKVGGKVYYKASDVEKLLNQNYHE